MLLKSLLKRRKNKGLGSVETLGLFFFMKGEIYERRIR